MAERERIGQVQQGGQTETPAAADSRKGVAWSHVEHAQFLQGLKKLGKGNWRGISKYYVQSRTPTQVASHAQKHFQRVSSIPKRKSRFSGLDDADRADESSAPGQGVFWGTEVPINSAAALAVSQIRQVGATGPPLDALGVIIPGGLPRGDAMSEEGLPLQFSKVCRPTAYRASARRGDLRRLGDELAPSAGDSPRRSSFERSNTSAFTAAA